MIKNAMRAAVTAACFIGMTSLASLAAGAFEGVWKVKDTAGQPFEITLSSGGIAKATRGEGMTGTWKEEGNAAVIISQIIQAAFFLRVCAIENFEPVRARGIWIGQLLGDDAFKVHFAYRLEQ